MARRPTRNKLTPIRLNERPSRSGEAARRDELERVNRMTGEERILLALELGAWLRDLSRRSPAGRQG